jgi:hypothetical protein
MEDPIEIVELLAGCHHTAERPPKLFNCKRLGK